MLSYFGKCPIYSVSISDGLFSRWRYLKNFYKNFLPNRVEAGAGEDTTNQQAVHCRGVGDSDEDVEIRRRN